MIIRKTVAIINVLLTGIVAVLISTFFASGGIGENYSDQTFVAPEFFAILVIWAIGALLVIWMFFKDSLYLFTLSLILTWLSIPVGIKMAQYVAYIFA
ncbi:hypothetical protein [Thalassobacillus devorans]|uniref:hypothetical protein n=1 Tax=Thalassobacillus devorans TaxID=279813 RepID=UPI0004AEF4B8|nr:hypothetical protein [Thalassobacillus devorans]